MKSDPNLISSQIKNLYVNILQREADETGLNYFLNSVVDGKMSISDVKLEMLNSEEYEVINPHHKLLKNIPPAPIPGFFDNFPDFQETSKTATKLNRLNMRYKAIIENNEHIISGSSILDIASHDGRWSFAALKNGASHVTGIEGRSHLVENANSIMKKYSIPDHKYNFKVGDIHKEILTLKPNTIDIVFCLGFFYHTIHNYFLLSEIKRLNPRYLILDTFIDPSTDSIIRVKLDDITNEANAIQNQQETSHVLVGFPSMPTLELMLKNLGFSFTYFNWHEKNILNWTYLGDYYKKIRITLLAKNLSFND